MECINRINAFKSSKERPPLTTVHKLPPLEQSVVEGRFFFFFLGRLQRHQHIIRKFYNFFPSDDHFDQNVSVKRSEGSMNPKKVTCGTWQVRFSGFTEPFCILYWSGEIQKERMERTSCIVRDRVRLASPTVLKGRNDASKSLQN